MILENDVAELKRDIDDLRSSNKWLLRTVAAALITGLVGIAFALIKTGAGV